MKISALVALAVSSCATARTITVYNGCPFTIWPATFTGVGATPDFATGWEADAYTSVSFSVPDNWQAGRIWARRDCNFDDPNPATQCLDGGCNGGLECDPTTGTGIPPATLAEFTLQGSGFVDYFDISMVDGYNLPMRIDNNQGCGVPDCAVDLGPNCKSVEPCCVGQRTLRIWHTQQNRIMFYCAGVLGHGGKRLKSSVYKCP